MSKIKTILATLFLVIFSAPVFAGNPIVIHPVTGDSIGWEDGANVPYWLDQGGLGVLTNEQASTLVNAMMNTWAGVATANVGFLYQGFLADDVTEKNIGDYLSAAGCNGSMRTDIPKGVVPIVFDTDGMILDSLYGEGASAETGGIALLRCFKGSAADPSSIYQAMLIINGQFVDGKSVDENSTPDLPVNVMAGIILHELGHLIGLDHTAVNEDIYEEVYAGTRPHEDSKYLPVMLPLVLRGSTSATMLKPDDIAAISSMYPAADFAGSVATIAGDVKKADGTEFQKANVIARSKNDPLCEVFSAVSGRRCVPLLDTFGVPNFNSERCSSADQLGDYLIEGVVPGEYTIEVEELPEGWIREGMFPEHVDENLPGSAMFYNGGEIVPVAAAQYVSSINFILDASEATPDQLDRLPVADFTAGPSTRCVADAVDYAQLLGDNVQVLPSQSADDAVAGSSGGGCSMNCSKPDVVMVWMLLFALLFVILSQRRRIPRVQGILRSAQDDNKLGKVQFMKKIFLSILILTILTSTAFATTIVPMSMDKIKEKAGHIFYGKCIDVKEVTTENGIPANEVTYKVLRGLRGAEEKTITFRTLSNTIGGAKFYKGKESVLFLHRESAIGLTSPVGLNQGDIDVKTMRDGTKRVMLNKRSAGGDISVKSIKKGDSLALSPDEFLDLVESDGL